MKRQKPQDFFSKFNIKHIDYKDVPLLKRFLNAHGKIVSSRLSHVSDGNQRKLSQAIKRARFMGLIPYIER